MDLILASSSPYRRQLLQRLGIAFECDPPEIDETPRPGESALNLVRRLAQEKAEKSASSHPGCLVIGSDQVAVLFGEVLTKPASFIDACRQLRSQSGQTVDFLTAVVLLNTASGRKQSATITTSVEFRQLDEVEISRYVDAEKPMDCAGSFKSEGLGIGLFERITSPDPTALIGLPLIPLLKMLRNEGIKVP